MRSLDRLNRWLAVQRTVQLMLIIIFGIVLFSATADQPFHLDNMDFPAVAKQTSATWIPVYYRGEENPQHIGLYHPPFYIYSLAVWIRLFGFGEVQVRMFGIACALLQATVVLAIIATLLGRAKAQRIAPWFLAVFLFNPYTLQVASIADIDSTLYGPVLCGILLCTLRITWRNGVQRSDEVKVQEFAVVSLLIVLALWLKLTTILLLFAALPPLFVARLGWLRSLLVSAMIVVVGVSGFALSYWAYGQLTGLDVTYSIDFTIQSFLNRGSSGGSGLTARVLDKVNNFRVMAPTHMTWTGLFPWITAGGALLLCAWHAVRKRSALHAHIVIVLGVALATTAYYCGQTRTFGAAPLKYTFVYWALVLVAPALLAFALYGSASVVTERRVGVVAAVVFAAFLYISCTGIRDEVISASSKPAYFWAWISPALGALIAIVLATKWTRGSRAMLVGSLAAYVGISLGIALHHARVPYSTTYSYGQLGFSDTVAFIHSMTGGDAFIVSMKDIGFAAGRRYFESYGGIHGGPDAAQHLNDIMASGKVEYAVFTEGRGEDQLIVNPVVREWMDANSTLVRSFGHYRIYRLNAAGAATTGASQ